MNRIYMVRFEIVKTGEILELEAPYQLYLDIKEGNKGLLTYNKNYALDFQKIGKIRKRKLSLGERTLKFFYK